MTVLVSQVNRLRKIKPEAVQVGAPTPVVALLADRAACSRSRPAGSGHARGEGGLRRTAAPPLGRGVGPGGYGGRGWQAPALIGTSRARQHGKVQPGVKGVLPAATAP